MMKQNNFWKRKQNSQVSGEYEIKISAIINKTPKLDSDKR